MARGSFQKAAFTLLELLTVMAIIAIIAGFTIPAASSILKGSQVNQAAQIVSDQLALARQTAISKSHAVEVRFYQYGDPEVPGEQATNPASGNYRAMQIFEIPDSGSAVAVGKMYRLPGTMIIDKSTTYSAIIGNAQTGSVPALSSGTALNVAIPRVTKNYNAVTFQFMPDGSTNLPISPTGQNFLTLRAASDLSAPPKNFYTLMIDPANGHIRPFRN